MPVNYSSPHPDSLSPVEGVRLGVAQAEIRNAGRKDLTVIALDSGCTVAGVFTENRFRAAPVMVATKHLRSADEIRALVINTGIANAGTGDEGVKAAETTCISLAALLNVQANQILPFSTGLILQQLPVGRVLNGLPICVSKLSCENWYAAAEAIMTTDTVAKAASRRLDVAGGQITITGIAKGAGMIKPNMATMLGFIATDARVSQTLLNRLVREVANISFNCITIDGDTSTNDSFVLISTHKSGLNYLTGHEPDWALVKEGIRSIAIELAQAIVRDGEGATKFITVVVEGGVSEAECRQVAYAVAQSPLTKTAFFASDPNLGRILAAIGNSRIADLDVERITVWLGEILVAEHGGRSPGYIEADAARVMESQEILLRINLGRGTAFAIIYTCDLSVEYVQINADYRNRS
jgi:glutamate N-acetyltransferase/amino-acid N-acetyltransferase